MSAVTKTSSTARRKKLNGHNTLHKFLSTRSQLQDIYQTTPFQLPPHLTTTMFEKRSPRAPHSNRKSKELSSHSQSNSSRNHAVFKVPRILTSGSSMLQNSRSMKYGGSSDRFRTVQAKRMKGKMIIGGGSIIKGLQSGEGSKEKITPRKVMA